MTLESEEAGLRVTFSDAAAVKQVTVECVVDCSYLGEYGGVEILDWAAQLKGAHLEEVAPSAPIRWSYDAEIDAIYFLLRPARAWRQLNGDATIFIDSTGLVVGFSVSFLDEM